MAGTNKTPKINKLRLRCPHCGSDARMRHSREHSPLYRDGILECQNIVECGWRGKVGVEILATLTASACPNPEIHLEQSPFVLPENAIPHKWRQQTLSPEQLAERNQIDLF